MPKMAPNKASPDFNPDVEIELVCKPGSVSILPGQETRCSNMSAADEGPGESLTTLPGSYLGPLMRFKQGQKVRIHLRNELDEATITHWHGLNVPALMDGHPMYAIDKGQTFIYEFEIRNRASMILYHPHTHGVTGEQVYHGLAGAILINDEEEERLKLPSGEYEIPIVIQDRMFDEQKPVGLRAQHARPHDRFSRRPHPGQRQAQFQRRRSQPRLPVCGCSTAPTRASTSWPGMMARPSPSSASTAACWSNRRPSLISCSPPANGWIFGRTSAGALSARNWSCAAGRSPACCRKWPSA